MTYVTYLPIMMNKIDLFYILLDDLEEDLSAMQEDLETIMSLLDEGRTSDAKKLIEEMNAFLVDFLSPVEFDDEECECECCSEEEHKHE